MPSHVLTVTVTGKDLLAPENEEQLETRLEKVLVNALGPWGVTSVKVEVVTLGKKG